MIHVEEDVVEKANHKVGHSKAGSVISNRSSISMLGYTPIPSYLLEKSVDYLLRWLNFYALSSPIQAFPADVINNNGSPVFDLIYYLTNKQLPYRAKIDGKFF